MNFQEKVFEATAELRDRALAFANVAVSSARTRAQAAAKRADALKGSLATLSIAGRELNKVARRHAQRFVKESSTIAADAGKDVSKLARTTYATLAKRPATARKARKAPAARKRANRKAA
ncbi:MAG TPA: hypothetical protein VFU13_04360 [Steroidobacteraceae bacterium]|nr:hypothetical protein [Steroidobacteraceae bacterium]